MIKTIQVFVVIGVLWLKIACQRSDHSFDLNKTASGGSITRGDAGEEEEVQSKHKVGTTERLSQRLPSDSTKKLRVIQKDIRRPYRPYGKGNNLSGLTSDGNCETHSVGCKHWKDLDDKTKKIHSQRLSRRRRMQDQEFRIKAKEYHKKWMNKYDREDLLQMYKDRNARDKDRVNSLPIKERFKVKRNKNESDRAYKARVKTIAKKVHPWDLNKTASSGIVIGGEEVGEEVQSKPLIHEETQSVGPAVAPHNRSVSPYARGTKRRILEDIGPIREKKSISGLRHDGTCESHSVGCSHWKDLSAEERRAHSKRLHQRRKQTIEEYRQLASERHKKRYRKMTGEEKKEYIHRKNQEQKNRILSLPKEIQVQLRARRTESKKRWKLRQKLKDMPEKDSNNNSRVT